MNWIDGLNEKDLVAMLPSTARREYDNPDDAAAMVLKEYVTDGLLPKPNVRIASKAPKAAPKKGAPKATKKVAPKVATKPQYSNWWQAIKAEFHLLVCTTDKKYAATRKQIGKHANTATVTIVGVISAAIASVLGIAAGIVVPFVVILLLTLANLGKNAYCGMIVPPT